MKIYPLILSALLLLACNDAGSYAEKNVMSSADMALSEPPPPPADEAGQLNREAAGGKQLETEAGKAKLSIQKISAKIRKTAHLDITVDDYREARKEVEIIVKAGNGYIGSESEQNSTYSISNGMMLRVMNKDFDAMVEKLLLVASHVNSKNISAEDVTAQFIDIQSRLASKKEIEKRYTEILSKATKVSDILEIEQKLGQIREEIEAKEGELKFLSDQVDYSTIYLSLRQDFEYTPTDRPGFLGRIGTAFGNGWSGFLSFVVGLVYAWPLWLILGLGAYFLVRVIRRSRKKKVERK